MKTLEYKWKSERLVYQDLDSQEISKVQELFETSNYINQWDGQIQDPEYINRCYFSGDLPPNGKKENYKIQTIKTNYDDELIGFICVYHGFPNTDVVYVPFMYIGIDYQKQGFGQEVINHLSKELTELDYKEIRINVAIKNWPALRFWIKLGFDKINGLYGDKEHSENTYANIELTRFL